MIAMSPTFQWPDGSFETKMLGLFGTPSGWTSR
jgi:hypothetical protein